MQVEARRSSSCDSFQRRAGHLGLCLLLGSLAVFRLTGLKARHQWVALLPLLERSQGAHEAQLRGARSGSICHLELSVVALEVAVSLAEAFDFRTVLS